MEVPVDPVVAVSPLELLLYIGLAIAGFAVVLLVCALLLAVVHVALPAPSEDEGGDPEAAEDRGPEATEDRGAAADRRPEATEDRGPEADPRT